MMLRRSLAATAILAGFVLAPPAFAQSKFTNLDEEPAIRSKIEYRLKRFEVGPYIGMSFVDGGMRRGLLLGGSLRYHFTDWIDAGLYGGGVVYNYNTKILSDVEDVRSTDPDILDPGEEWCDAEACERLREGVAHFYLQANFTPFAGKASLFGKGFFHLDVYAFFGFGIVVTRRYNGPDGVDNTANNPGDVPDSVVRPVFASFGVGTHLYTTDFLAVVLELRDSLISESWAGVPAIGDPSKLDNRLVNYMTFNIGANFFIPLKAKISK